jgi:hypothetical protein
MRQSWLFFKLALIVSGLGVVSLWNQKAARLAWARIVYAGSMGDSGSDAVE